MELIQVLPQLHLVRFPVGQTYLWHDGAEITLIDTGVRGSGTAIREAIGAIDSERTLPDRIVLTHWHPDHAGSVAELVEQGPIPVYAHHLDAPVIRGDQAGPPPVLTEAERSLLEKTVPEHPDAPPAPVDHEVTDGDVLDFGDGARVIGMPGHTDGSIALLLAEHGVLFTGDSVTSMPGTACLGPFNTDRETAIASMRGLSRFDARLACFGHGDPLLGDVAEMMRTAAVDLPEA